MKKLLLYCLTLTLAICSCSKDEECPCVETKNHIPKMVESIIYDPNGVVFKITNDINQGYNYQEIVEHGNSFWENIDTIYLKRFYSMSNASVFDSNYVRIGKGDYICWRYNYVYQGYRNIYMAFKNPRTNNLEYSHCIYGTALSYGDNNWFKARFPEPINDTVKVMLSSFFAELH
jgi:hypothetical protein